MMAKSGPVYRVKSMSMITQPRIETMDWAADAPWLSICFKPAPLRRGRVPKFKISSGYNPVLWCSSVKSLQVTAQPVMAEGISSRLPENLAELKKVYHQGYLSYVKEWGKKLGPAFIKNAAKYEADYLPKSKSLIVFRHGAPCGLFSHVAYTDIFKKKYAHITWHNLLPGLSAAEKRAARYQAALWLKKTVKKPVSVTLDLFEKESYDFFAGLGLVASRLLLERRKK